MLTALLSFITHTFVFPSLGSYQTDLYVIKCCLRHSFLLYRHVFRLFSKKYLTFLRKCRRICLVLSRIHLFCHPLALIKPTITSKKCCLRHFFVLFRHVFHLISKKYLTFSRKCRRLCLVLQCIRCLFNHYALFKPTKTSYVWRTRVCLWLMGVFRHRSMVSAMTQPCISR